MCRPSVSNNCEVALPVANSSAIDALIGASNVAFFLDYDGTLAPIVDQPEKAYISEECRETLRALRTAYPVSLVSGRSNEKLRAFLKIADGLYLAGSHGLHIIGPTGEKLLEVPSPEAMVPKSTIAALAAARAELDEALGSVPGYLTEDNVYCITAHYRMVDPTEHSRVHDVVHDVLSRHPSLCHKSGKMVHELRPAVTWDKGKAVETLIAMLRQRRDDSPSADDDAQTTQQLLPIYLGDDVADEAAFQVVRALGGIGIKVSDGPVTPDSTAATWSVRQPDVVGLLRSFLPG